MDPFEILATSRAEFERRLRMVADGQWELPTPCEGWDVRRLVTHVVAGDALSVVLLHGAMREEGIAVLGGDRVGDGEPLDAFLRSAAASEAAFREDGAFERTVHHPGGDFDGFTLFGFRVTDYLVHGWDLARAIGADEALDADVVALVHDGMQQLGSSMYDTGFFRAPSGSADDGADLQDEMLRLAGRRP